MESNHINDKINEEELNIVDWIMQFETGEISEKNFFKLFSHLIKTGKAWSLQGFYGRTAKAVIEQGYINQDGKINWDLVGGL